MEDCNTKIKEYNDYMELIEIPESEVSQELRNKAESAKLEDVEKLENV